MFDNHTYNLIKQTVQEHKSLWRIKNNYQDDAGDCSECQTFWKKMVADKENHVKELKNLIKNHLS